MKVTIYIYSPYLIRARTGRSRSLVLKIPIPQDVLRFWLDVGVDGFRIDALPFIIEDQSFVDEPLIDPNMVDDNYTYFLLDHVHSRDQLGTYRIVEEFREVLDEYTNKDGNTRLLSQRRLIIYNKKKTTRLWGGGRAKYRENL